MKREKTSEKLIHRQIKIWVVIVMLILLAGISLAPSKIMSQTEENQSEINKSATKIKELEEEIVHKEEEIKKLQDTLVEQEMEIGQLQKGEVERPIHPTVERLRTSLEHVREKNEKLSQQLDETDSDKLELLQKENEELEEKVSSLQEKIKRKDKKLRKHQNITEERENELEKLETELREMKETRTVREGQKVTVTLDEAILFPAGKAELKSSASSTFQKFIEIAKSYPDFRVFVEGHTDNLPMKETSNFGSNWELSVMRAVNVVQYIEENSDIASDRLVAAGYGPHQPVATNDSPENRELNRRVEISLIPPSLIED